jgi:outer membrane protein OmpA-like peptidoglycan-associated protein
MEIGDEIMNSTRAEDQARDNYEQAARLDPTNIEANFKAGFFRLHSIHKSLSTPFLEKVKELNQNYRFDIDYLIGNSYQVGLEFDKAIEHYMLYEGRLSQRPTYRDVGYVSAEEVSKRIEECNYGKELIKNPVDKDIISLGNSINSEYDDFGPVFNEDETIIVFTSRRREDNLNENVDDDNMPYEDIYYAHLDNGEWGNAVNLGKDINTPFHESNLVMSHDGAELYIYKEVNNGDIYVTQKNVRTGLWSDPVPLGPNINSEEYSENSMTISQDENMIIFASDKPGGIGGFDFYYSIKGSDGLWGNAANLGNTINTPWDEDGPFLDYDGKTLYFSSEGHDSMGGLDIFKSVYDSTAGSWSKPENIGYPINTADNDVFYIPSRDGKNAYYASVKEDGPGFLDIYRIADPEVEPDTIAAPVLNPIALIISVDDMVSKDHLDASVTLTNLSDNSEVKLIKEEVGKYSARIEPKQRTTYRLDVNMPGYIFETRNINVPAMSEEELEIDRIISLRKPKVNTRKVLRNIYFEFDKAVFLKGSMNELGNLVKMMADNPSITVEISGHTDNVGNAAYNKSLSQKRADAVREHLITNGVAANRVSSVGFGEEKPLASNDDEREGRELNRRVEFKVTGN